MIKMKFLTGAKDQMDASVMVSLKTTYCLILMKISKLLMKKPIYKFSKLKLVEIQPLLYWVMENYTEWETTSMDNSE